ncbi:hypothetical protein ATZ33_00890 [Enterococcus silesiacus]|uniref:NIPSNAP family containing protein n=1 Tax=Enterococcus silesiacus TaxID=332949 RepID=A0A0S3K6T2_9ENTE|nr:hypothetical protein [Enterococcus silesiacus]ALR99987.1 hypothetical protein ATZ33_00890 [Enterococcus silesiacus]OJG92701.1 hypothetical protein RV15_GL002646 [Enterococcus silesiacus]
MNKNEIWEVLIYKLKENTGSKFHKIMMKESMPLHKKKGMKIVNHGQALHDPDTYFLIRAYHNLQHLEASQHEFYSDEEWLDGPREKIIALIDSSTKTIIPSSML